MGVQRPRGLCGIWNPNPEFFFFLWNLFLRFSSLPWPCSCFFCRVHSCLYAGMANKELEFLLEARSQETEKISRKIAETKPWEHEEKVRERDRRDSSTLKDPFVSFWDFSGLSLLSRFSSLGFCANIPFRLWSIIFSARFAGDKKRDTKREFSKGSPIHDFIPEPSYPSPLAIQSLQKHTFASTHELFKR